MKHEKAGASRRQFLTGVTGAGALAGLPRLGAGGGGSAPPPRRLPIVYFSKHLQWLDWEPMAATAAELGFDGIDLTVRQGGHVEPDRVETDLPKVAKIVRSAGLEIPMITAEIVDADSPRAEAIIRTASEVGIYRYRWGWFAWSEENGTLSEAAGRKRPYPELIDVPARLEHLQRQVAGLARLNEKYQVCAMYHNHSGPLVGASVWDLWVLLKEFSPQWVSSNFDVAHATVEGGLGGWIDSTRLMAPFLRGTAIKDFKWGTDAKGVWEPQWCPLGQGMVNFPAYFAMIKQANFSGPVQLHTEYPLGGVQDGNRTLTMDKAQVLASIRQDLRMLKGWMHDAELI